ncbi:MAG: TQO small subunit DoxD [Gemmatimonadota bacterium]
MKRPDAALAALRIVVGLWFAKALAAKLSWSLWAGVLPVPHVSDRWINFLAKRLVEYAGSNPPDAYKAFLLNTAIPHHVLFAHLTAIGEIAVGIGLTLGLLTVLTSLGGLWLIANYFVATLGLGFNQEGFHILLIACMLAFIAARAGRTWGLDGWLLRRHPNSYLARLRLS